MTGPAPAAHRLDGVQHHRCGGDHVVAVDRGVAKPVALGPTLELRRVLVGGGGELGVPVVLAEEDDRKLPHRGEVHRLVERALCHRAIAEERHHHAVISPQLGRGGGAHRDREAGGHDPVGAEDADPGIGDVHRAAASAIRTRVLRHELGEHPRRVETLRQAVAVPAMRRCDHVGGRERPARTHRGRFLSDGQVHEAGDLAVAVQRGDPLLEPTDQQHPPVHLDEIGLRERRSGRSTVVHVRCIVPLGPGSERAKR